VNWRPSIVNLIERARVSLKLRGGLFVLASLGVQVIVPVLAVPATLSNLDQTAFGRFQYSLSIHSWLVILTAPYITVGAASAIARGKQGSLWDATRARLLLSLVVSAITVMVALYLRPRDHALGMLLLISVIGILAAPIASVASTYCIAAERFAALALWDSLSVIPTIALALSSYSQNIFVAAIAFYASGALVSIAGTIITLHRFPIRTAFVEGRIESGVVAYGLKSLPMGLLTSTRRQLGSLIIGYLAGYNTLAVFSVGMGLATKLLDAASIFDRIWLADFASKSQDAAIGWVRSKMLVLILAGLAITVGFGAVSVVYIRGFLPQAYTGAWPIALIVSIAFPATLVYQAIMLSLVSHLQARKQVIAQSIFSLAEIVLAVVLGVPFGIWGICAAVVAARYIAMLAAYVQTRLLTLGDADVG
jgi:O-antigen/teichoic acid export membrane protein